MEEMEMGSELARPRHIQKTPPRVWRIHRFHRRPLMPKRRAARSDMSPPMGRATKFAIPNVAAMVPAV